MTLERLSPSSLILATISRSTFSRGAWAKVGRFDERYVIDHVDTDYCMRALGRAKLREVIEDPTKANPDTVMPPYGRHRILEPAEIQKLVEFLLALP